ncbi:MAG TPA: isoprenylcysteine carboxylmethyltransferase family protein [Methanomicrobia archaeon]|nr:isoprenylcysteine carboxylmethyltransferase family protein [Methanomicrobia archaeon]
MVNNNGTTTEFSQYLKIVVKGFFALLIIIAIIFILAGRLSYWQGWVFSIVTVLLVTAQLLVFAGKTELARERFKPGPGTKWWDKLLLALYGPLFFAIVIIACLDAGRFRWSPELPLAVYITSYLGYGYSIYLYSWAMWVNQWFSSTVRIQTDRDQQVVQDGPYRYVRHPGYVAGILMALSTAVALGSLWALVPAALVVLLLIIRTALEDRTLQNELPGYAEYAHTVRYRLIPGLW